MAQTTRNGNADADTKSIGDCDVNPIVDTHANCDCDVDSNIDVNAHAYRDRHRDGNTKADSDTAA